MLPFHGQQLFFGVVAFFAAGHDIALGALAAAGYGHAVIHGQIFGRERPAAVMADPFGQAAFPPLGFAQRSGLVTLPFLVVCAKIIGIGLDGGFFFSWAVLYFRRARWPALLVILIWCSDLQAGPLKEA